MLQNHVQRPLLNYIYSEFYLYKTRTTQLTIKKIDIPQQKSNDTFFSKDRSQQSFFNTNKLNIHLIAQIIVNKSFEPF